MHKLKDYTVISRKAQVWDEVTVFEATSEADAIEQAREEHNFHVATMRSEHIEFIRIARADEIDGHALNFLESIK